MIIWIILIIQVISICNKCTIVCAQLHSLLETLELQTTHKRRGHFALYNCLVLGNTKYPGVQRIYCDPFPKKTFYSRNRMDLVIVRPPGVAPGGFVLCPDSVWYCRVLLLFTASALTDTGSTTFECAFVSVLDTCDSKEHGTL